MNVLKTVDRDQGTNRGKVLDIDWKQKLTVFIDQDFTPIVAEIKTLILNKSRDFKLMNQLATDAKEKVKAVGLMRSGMILDVMAKSVSPDRVSSNVQEIDKFKGMLPLLLQEAENCKYFLDQFLKRPLTNEDVIHKKDQPIPSQKVQLPDVSPQPTAPPKKGAFHLAEIPKFKPKPKPNAQKKEDSDEEIDFKRARDADDVLVSKSQFKEDEDKEGETAEEARKKARAEMRAKLMLPDSVVNKLNNVNQKKAEVTDLQSKVEPKTEPTPPPKEPEPVSEPKKEPTVISPKSSSSSEDDPEVLFLRKQKQRREALLKKKQEEEEQVKIEKSQIQNDNVAREIEVKEKLMEKGQKMEE